MKSALLAAAAVAAVTFSSGAAFAETANTSVWRPFGPTQTTKKVRPAHRHYHTHQTYRPVYTPGPVRASAANLGAVKRNVYADGRVTFFEKIKLGIAERRHDNVVRSYR